MKRAAIILAMLCVVTPSENWAADEPVFQIEMKDGVITPSRIEVPAKTRFKIIVKNTGKMPAEFESTELRKEVIVPSGGEAPLISARWTRANTSFSTIFSLMRRLRC